MQTEQTPTAATGETPIEDCFEASYAKSRERLLASIGSISGIHPVLVDSRSIPTKGPDGETLATDFIIIGARRPRKVLVISSGTHGVEGFAGSAIQHDFIEHRLPSLKLAADTAVIIDHAHNPYGFAWLRRVSEDNIDINRNFMDQFDTEKVSPDYVALHDALNPPDLDPDAEAQRWAQINALAETHGLTHVQKVIIEGQYHYPEGVQFGGQRRAPCVQNLLDLVDEHLSAATEILWIDIHTGLGESGECELISGMPAGSPSLAFAREVWPEVVSASAGESLSTPLNGLMDIGISHHVPADARFAMVFPEYGTLPVDRVIRAMPTTGSINTGHKMSSRTRPAAPSKPTCLRHSDRMIRFGARKFSNRVAASLNRRLPPCPVCPD